MVSPFSLCYCQRAKSQLRPASSSFFPLLTGSSDLDELWIGSHSRSISNSDADRCELSPLPSPRCGDLRRSEGVCPRRERTRGATRMPRPTTAVHQRVSRSFLPVYFCGFTRFSPANIHFMPRASLIQCDRPESDLFAIRSVTVITIFVVPVHSDSTRLCVPRPRIHIRTDSFCLS